MSEIDGDCDLVLTSDGRSGISGDSTWKVSLDSLGRESIPKWVGEVLSLVLIDPVARSPHHFPLRQDQSGALHDPGWY